MTLAEFQRTIKSLLMTREGKQALQSLDTLENYLSQHQLNETERQSILRVPLDRLQQYEFMLQANVQETLENIFPYTYEILEADWDDLVEDYFIQLEMTSYPTLIMAESFPDFLQTRSDVLEKGAFLPNLALYEYLEAALLNEPNVDTPQKMVPTVPETVEALSQWIPVYNEVSVLEVFSYPVSAIIEFLKTDDFENIDEALIAPKLTPMWLHRDAQSYICRFFELNPLLAEFLRILQVLHEDGPLPSYADCIRPLYEAFSAQNPQISRDVFYRELLSALVFLLDKGILLGSIAIDVL